VVVVSSIRNGHRDRRLQSLAGATGGTLHPSVHRHGLRLQRVLAAAVARARHYRGEGCPDMSLMQELFTTTCDWRVASMGWMYTLFFVLLGVSAAVWGGWLDASDRARPALFRPCAGVAVLVLGAIGTTSTSFGCCGWAPASLAAVGLGLGYISPVSTLVKWFPDRRGMATGMAIMGFGGGAMIGAPLANLLMNYFKTSTSVGAWETFLAMGAIYFCFMMIGAFRYAFRPPAGAQRAGRRPKKPTR